jgi:hypothetical protein
MKPMPPSRSDRVMGHLPHLPRRQPAVSVGQRDVRRHRQAIEAARHGGVKLLLVRVRSDARLPQHAVQRHDRLLGVGGDGGRGQQRGHVEPGADAALVE